MRKLRPLPLFIFILLQLIVFVLTKLLTEQKCFETNVFYLISIFLLINVLVYRIILFLIPIPEGDLKEGSRAETIWMINLCFWLTYFHPLKNINIIPVYLSPFTNRLFGGKMSLQSFSAGLLFDPHLIVIREGSFVGNRALLVPHYQEGRKFGHKKITIGKNVTIGANSVVLSGVVIEDNAIVGAMSLVTKNSIIKTGEVWAGVPAVKIK